MESRGIGICGIPSFHSVRAEMRGVLLRKKPVGRDEEMRGAKLKSLMLDWECVCTVCDGLADCGGSISLLPANSLSTPSCLPLIRNSHTRAIEKWESCQGWHFSPLSPSLYYRQTKCRLNSLPMFKIENITIWNRLWLGIVYFSVSARCTSRPGRALVTRQSLSVCLSQETVGALTVSHLVVEVNMRELTVPPGPCVSLHRCWQSRICPSKTLDGSAALQLYVHAQEGW